MIVAVLVAAVVLVAAPRHSVAVTTQRLSLRVLVLDDGSPWVDGLASQLAAEGVPYQAVAMSDPARPVINAAFLSQGGLGLFQAVIAPDYLGGSLSSSEVTALRAYEATFAVREIDAYNWANPAIGLNYAGFSGDLAGLTATVTADGINQGFQYLNGPVPFAQGSYSFVAVPLSATSNPPMPPGASFSTLVSAPIQGSPSGSIVGVFANAGVEQMVITSAMNFYLPQFKLLAHGMISWATRGVHLGYNRNRMTFDVDDAFSDDALWDAQNNCTPDEDCPRDADGNSIYPLLTNRMTPADVDFAVQWQASHGYKLTLAFNGANSAPDDPLTQAMVANKASFNWLNHGFEHIFQGCVQNFTVAPWQCATDPAGNIAWVTQQQVYDEITQNITVGTGYGLPFDPTEYLSGEHSGLFRQPQQPVDNPNFGAALTQAGIKVIGADASREPGSRQVGSALTIPRHPTSVYYNAATVQQEVDEYNYLYTNRANGGGGYCEDNPATATCIAPLDTTTGYASYIVPTDAAFDLSFILSNDPRPFYAHVSNLSGDRILYPLLESILGTYNAAFTAATPLQNLSFTAASSDLQNQGAWATNGMAANPAVTAYVQQGQVVITNNSGGSVPVTVPEGASVNGATLLAYGGERSAWLAPAATTTVNLPAPPPLTIAGSTTFSVGSPGSAVFSVAATPAVTISETGTLPGGLAFVAGTDGTGTISGTPAAGTAGTYPITVTRTTGSGRYDTPVTVAVIDKAVITSANATTVRQGTAFTFNVTSAGTPSATISMTGGLPSGVVFTPLTGGAATLSGTPVVNSFGTYPLVFTATNPAGSTTQAFTLTVGRPPVFTSATTANALTGQAFSFVASAVGPPTATVTGTGALPSGVTLAPQPDGTLKISGTPGPNSYGTYTVNLTATNTYGSVKQTLTLNVNSGPSIFSNPSTTFTVGTAGTFTAKSEGLPKPVLSLAGSLPSGVTFVPAANSNGVLSGTPAAGSGGLWSVVITSRNSVGATTQAFTLTVREAPTITSASTVSFTKAKASSFTITTTGWPVPTITKSGTLPPGTTFTAASDGTAKLSGTPTTAGTWTLTIAAKNAVATVNQTLTIKVV